MKGVLLFSGGLDSVIAWEKLGRPNCLYIDLGHRYNENEKASIIQFAERDWEFKNKLRIHTLKDIGKFEEDNANIPLRNLYLVMLAVNFGYDKVWITLQEDEMDIPDRSERFLKDTSYLLTFLLGNGITVETPFRDMDKTDMVEWYIEEGHKKKNLLESWSCYENKLEPCGECPACFRRFVALSLNDIKEDWYNKVRKSNTAKIYRIRAEHGYYSDKRNKRIKNALGGDL